MGTSCTYEVVVRTPYPVHSTKMRRVTVARPSSYFRASTARETGNNTGLAGFDGKSAVSTRWLSEAGWLSGPWLPEIQDIPSTSRSLRTSPPRYAVAITCREASSPRASQGTFVPILGCAKTQRPRQSRRLSWSCLSQPASYPPKDRGSFFFDVKRPP